jgi:hypothetical protein
MRKPKTKEEVLREEAKAQTKINHIKAFRRSRHYKTIMFMLENEFNKDSLDGNLGKMSTLEQMGMIAAIQTEAKRRFYNVKNTIEGI